MPVFARENSFDALIDGALGALPAVVRPGVAPRPSRALIKAIIAAESGFDPRAHNAEGAASAADDSFGLMQVKLPTARALGFNDRPEALYDPAVNIKYGVRLVGDLWARYKGREDAVFASYNAGMNKDGSLKIRPDGSYINQAYVTRSQRFLDYFRGLAPAPVTGRVQTAGLDRGAMFWLALVLLLGAVLGRGPGDD